VGRVGSQRHRDKSDIITHSKFLISADEIDLFVLKIHSVFILSDSQTLIPYKVGVLLILHSINSILIYPVLLNYTKTQTKQKQHISTIQQCATRSTLLCKFTLHFSVIQQCATCIKLLYNTNVLCLTAYFF
jgi:hypothetical protein